MNARRPLIGLTSRIDFGGRRFFLNEAYSRAVVMGGGIPLILPPVVTPEEMGPLLETLDALILTGGEDVNPAFYGALPHPKLGAVDLERDRFEIALCRAWLATGKPLFGICRGMQLLNVAAGGTLIQDLPSERPTALGHALEGAVSAHAHDVEVEEGTRLSRCLGLDRGERTVSVNSRHHQAVALLAPGFRVSAVAPDGIIEAIEAKEGRLILGVQWHPEDLVEAYPEQLSLFTSLARAASDGLR